MSQQKQETLLEKERFELKPKSGGGILSYEAWGYRDKGITVITRYNLAYINPSIFQSDNGRVLGFDNAHGYHHRHYMGNVEPVRYDSYEATTSRFQNEWQAIVDREKEVKK